MKKIKKLSMIILFFTTLGTISSIDNNIISVNCKGDIFDFISDNNHNYKIGDKYNVSFFNNGTIFDVTDDIIFDVNKVN